MRAVAFAVLIALSTLLTPAANSQTADAPATSCDTYAASDLDPQRKANGVPFNKINSVLAVPACESAVRQYPNSVRLIYQLGRAYAKKNDFRSAFAQYQKAADQGYGLAEYNIGVLYEKGLGVAKDEMQAVNWYRRAGEHGFVLAQYNLGNMYRNGQGIVQDYVEALIWLRKAAEQGNASAMGNLGVMYANAQGVAQDYAAAVSWWLKAAEQGEVISQTHLGSAYYFGQGVPQNHGEAAKWFQLAADQGYANAQYLLGLLYEVGDGVPKNVAQAADWYHKAAAQGNDEARRKLVALDTDAKAGRAAEEAGNAALRKAVAAGKTTPQAWEEAALAAGRAASDVELAAGRAQEEARQVAQQATDQVRARAPKVGAGEPGTLHSFASAPAPAPAPAPDVARAAMIADDTGQWAGTIRVDTLKIDSTGKGSATVCHQSEHGPSCNVWTFDCDRFALLDEMFAHSDYFPPFMQTPNARSTPEQNAELEAMNAVATKLPATACRLGGMAPPVENPQWIEVRENSGEVKATIDVATVKRDANGNAHARVCLNSEPGVTCPNSKIILRWYFDCRTHEFSWLDTTFMPQLPREMKLAQPNSVADKLATLACR
jgi:TPR repeat protein